MKNHQQKMRRVVQIVDGSIEKTSNDLAFIRRTIRETLGVKKCTRQMLNDFGTLRMELVDQANDITSETDEILELLEEHPDNRGTDENFAKRLADEEVPEPVEA